ncbi:PD-(D/E)XK nuclease family transposase [Bacteroides sp. GD17]|uniref:PD-(D/E)XK nuclease family transposase n=1 Tax=Bacteroides sp. GD17 TaxID=3139826 RepID=UPI00406C173A
MWEREYNRPHKFRTDIWLVDRDTNEPFSDKLRFIFIELPSFTKEEQNCETDFERWIYVLKNMETLKRLPFKGRMEGLKETARNLKRMKMSAEVIQQATGLSAEEIEKL